VKRLSAMVSAVLGLALRLPNLGWGLPDVAEEAYPMKKALEMWDWQAGSIAWNPQTIGWPSLSFYVHLSLQHLHYAVGRLAGQFGERLDYLVAFCADHQDLLILSRLIGVLASCGVIYLAARLSQRLVGNLGGWLAGILLALSPLLISHAQLITPDILLTLFAALGTVASVRVYEKGLRRDYLLAGLWLGLGISCKYTPVLLFGALYGAHLLARRRDTGGLVWSDFLAPEMGMALGTGFLAFVVTSPFFLLDADLFNRDVTYQLLHMNQGHFGHKDSLPGFVFYFTKVLAPGLGLPALLLSLMGLGVMAWRKQGGWLVLVLSLLCFYLPLSLVSTHFDRYMLPVLLPLAVGLSAWPILIREFWHSRKWTPRFLPACTVILLTLVLLPTVKGAMDYHRDKSRPSTLHEARKFILDSLGPGQPVIAMEAYTPQLQDDIRRELHLSDNYQLLSDSQKNRVRLEERIQVEYIPMYSVRVELAAYYYDLRHYQPFTHLVVSSAVRRRYLDEPERFPNQVRFYADLDRYATLVKRFSSADGMSGPEILIFEMNPEGMSRLLAERGPLDKSFHQAYEGRLHMPHYQAFLRGVAHAADKAESWSLAAFYFDSLTEALAADGNNSLRMILWERSAYTHLMAKQYSQSVRAAELFLKENPDSVRLWGYLGRASVGLGDVTRGRACFERILLFVESDPEIESWRQWALNQLADLPETE
jgi:Dolichyl-phosphate-mannose-protein mannosyltransferase